MIEPTEQDIGRAVVYQAEPEIVEQGVITSFNDHWVFVRYGSSLHSAATMRDELEWLTP